MEQTKDSYLTIEGNAEAIFKDKSSKFLCYAFHVESEEVEQTKDIYLTVEGNAEAIFKEKSSKFL